MKPAILIFALLSYLFISEPKITADSLLGDVIRKYPQTLPIFKKYGMPDYAIERLPMEKIAFFVLIYRVDLNTLLGELNGAVQSKG